MGGERYRIASFNMYQFNLRSDASIKKDLALIAKIIQKNSFDIVAMQEVLTPEVIKLLLRHLPGWNYRWAQPRYMTDDRFRNKYTDNIKQRQRVKGFSMSQREAEGYAFLWNTQRFDLASYRDKNGQEKIFEPRIYNQYRLDRKSGQQPLARNPYYGKFMPLFAGRRRGIELRLINTHITFGDTGKANLRRQELKVLFDQVYRKIHNDRIDETDPNIVSYTIMMGDYNLNLKRQWTKTPFMTAPDKSGNSMEVYTIPDSISSVQPGSNAVGTIVTVQESLSTLSRPDRDNYNENRQLANNFDHFSYSQRYGSDGICKKAYAVNEIKYVSNEYKPRDPTKVQNETPVDIYKRAISDHLPISMDIII